MLGRVARLPPTCFESSLLALGPSGMNLKNGKNTKTKIERIIRVTNNKKKQDDCSSFIRTIRNDDSECASFSQLAVKRQLSPM